MEIYAPLAHRLGMWQIKWELEDLSFKYIEPERYRQLVEMLADRRKVRESFINKSIGILRKELAKVDIKADISGRPKHLYSIAKKMERKGVEFDEIYDVNAIRPRRRRQGLLRRPWRRSLSVEADSRAVRRLHRHAQGEHVPVAAHRRHRARCQAAGGPDPHRPHARRGRGRDRGALALQGGLARRPALRREAGLGPAADGLAAGSGRCHRVRGGPQAGGLPGPGLRLHPEGRCQGPAGRRHAAGLRLPHPHRRRAPDHRRQGQQPAGAARLPPAQRRHRRDHHHQGRAWAVARLAEHRPDQRRAREDPPMVQAPAARREHRPGQGPAGPELRRVAHETLARSPPRS